MSDDWESIRTALAVHAKPHVVIISPNDIQAQRIREDCERSLGDVKATYSVHPPPQADNAFRVEEPKLVVLDESVPEAVRELLSKLAKERNPLCVIIDVQGWTEGTKK